jgi:3-oxoacyl-[acyl-carrier-protein] synthase-3
LIEGAVIWLPPERETAEAAIAAGRLDPPTAERDQYTELPVSRQLAAPQMAVRAARDVLAQAGWPPREVDLLCHSWIYHQGHDFWSPAHHVAHHIAADRAVPIGIQQMCNGGACGVELAATRLLTDPAVTRALVTSADRFDEAGFDRWKGDYGVGYGDGAAAVALRSSPTGGPARAGALYLRSVVSVADSRLERMHRGDDMFTPAPRWQGGRVDIRRTKKAFLASAPESFVEIASRSVRQVISTALRDADLAADDPRIRAVVLPRLGRQILDSTYVPAASTVVRAPAADFGRRTGHLGAGDLLANIADARDQNLAGSDGVILVLSAGAGFTWSCAVLDARPPNTGCPGGEKEHAAEHSPRRRGGPCRSDAVDGTASAWGRCRVRRPRRGSLEPVEGATGVAENA